MIELTLAQAAEGLRKKEFSSVDLTKGGLERMKSLYSKVHRLVETCED